MDDELRCLREQITDIHSPSEFAAFVECHPEVTQECEHEYPFSHRLHDVRIDDRGFRIGRCVLCNERWTVTLIPAEIVSPDLGVPFRLTGIQLRKWVAREYVLPVKGPTRWEDYLGGKANGENPLSTDPVLPTIQQIIQKMDDELVHRTEQWIERLIHEPERFAEFERELLSDMKRHDNRLAAAIATAAGSHEDI